MRRPGTRSASPSATSGTGSTPPAARHRNTIARWALQRSPVRNVLRSCAFLLLQASAHERARPLAGILILLLFNWSTHSNRRRTPEHFSDSPRNIAPKHNNAVGAPGFSLKYPERVSQTCNLRGLLPRRYHLTLPPKRDYLALLPAVVICPKPAPKKACETRRAFPGGRSRPLAGSFIFALVRCGTTRAYLRVTKHFSDARATPPSNRGATEPRCNRRRITHYALRPPSTVAPTWRPAPARRRRGCARAGSQGFALYWLPIRWVPIRYFASTRHRALTRTITTTIATTTTEP